MLSSLKPNAAAMSAWAFEKSGVGALSDGGEEVGAWADAVDFDVAGLSRSWPLSSRTDNPAFERLTLATPERIFPPRLAPTNALVSRSYMMSKVFDT